MRTLLAALAAALLLPVTALPVTALPASAIPVTGLPATAAPAQGRVPDGLAVTGWILHSASNRLVARNADGLSTLSVAAVSINPRGSRVEQPSDGARRLARAAHRHGLTAELLLSNWSNRLNAFDARAAHRLLSHPRRIQRVARQLARYVAEGGWDGINVDLERLREGDSGGLVDLVQAIQDAMPEEKTVTIDVSARSWRGGYQAGGYDLAGLAAAVDRIKLMTYDEHGPGWSDPGPIGSRDWQRRCLEVLLEEVPAELVDLGVAGYGYTWTRAGGGRTVTVAQARRLVERDGAVARWRPGPAEWTARLSNGTRIWWSDARSYRKRVQTARKYDLHGLAVWRLGSADTLG